ncbi:MAG: DUF5615 family PIN-like protein [Bacillota bacterium]
MKILVDECIRSRVVDYLVDKGHDVIWIQDKHEWRSMSDEDVFSLAKRCCRYILTANYHDFGDTRRFPPDECAGIVALAGVPYPSPKAHIRRLEKYPEIFGHGDFYPHRTVLVHADKIEILD